MTADETFAIDWHPSVDFTFANMFGSPSINKVPRSITEVTQYRRDWTFPTQVPISEMSQNAGSTDLKSTEVKPANRDDANYRRLLHCLDADHAATGGGYASEEHLKRMHKRSQVRRPLNRRDCRVLRKSSIFA